MGVFPLFYAGNLAYYSSLISDQNPRFEAYEHFPKQTFRNRMEILGPNGRQKLVIPTLKTGQRRTTKEVEISYRERWQKDHWKSLEAAYRRSPYFEFYEHRFRPMYKEETTLLFDFNKKIHVLICDILGIEIPVHTTVNYEDQVDRDHRKRAFDTWQNEQRYMQVFEDRHPFIPNLSILDAIFNLGPDAKSMIQ